MNKSTRRPENLGGMGESFFRLLAKDAGLVANASDDDKAGWDFEVEVPSPLALDYSSQSKPVFRVQVKATMGDALTIAMTFSSLLSLIQFGGPAFVCLICFGDNPTPSSVYLLHVDEARALDILMALRMKQVKNPDLKVNKSKVRLMFGEETRLNMIGGAELRRVLDVALKGNYLSYIEAKVKWLRNIEDESTRRRWNMRMEDDDAMQAMADCCLGYDRPFNVSSVMYFAPMGIPDKEIEHPETFTPTSIKPILKDLPKATVRLCTAEYGPKYEFKATMYSVPDHFPRRYASMRIRADLFDIVIRLEPHSIEFRPVDLGDDELTASVKEFRSFIVFMAEALEGDTTYFEIVPSNGAASLKLALETTSITVSEDFYDLRATLEATYLKLATLGLTDEVMRPSHLLKRRSHFELLQHVGNVYEPAFSFDFQMDGEFQAGTEVTVFSSAIDLSEKTLLIFAAFYGSVEPLGGGDFHGTFSRSEYLGELIVPAGHDMQSVCKAHSEKLRESLRKRGLAAM